jgi:hypothetical protein
MSYSCFARRRSVPLQVEELEKRCVLSSAEFVTGLYTNFLHRLPAPSEVQGWVAALDTGAASPQQVALSFTTSDEYRSNLIRTDYQVFLQRTPAPQEVAGWLGALQGGLSEEGLQAAFLASDEFFIKQGNDATAWLKAIYQDVLGRPIDPSGQTSFTQALRNGIPRDAIAFDIVDSPEAHTLMVESAYHDLFKRAADAGGLSSWVAALNAGMQPSELLADLASSEEFIGLVAHGVLDPVVAPVIVPVEVPVVVPVDTFVPDPFLGDPFLPVPFIVGATSCGCSATGFSGTSSGF